MKIGSFIIFILSVFIFVQCKEEKVNSVKSVTVRGKSLICSDFDGKTFVGLKDSSLIVRPFGKFLFETYNINKNSISKKQRFGTKGQGPKEFNFPISFFDKQNSKLFAVENYSVLGNGCIIDIGSHNVEDIRTWKSFGLKWMKTFYASTSFVPLNEDTLLFLGAYPKNKSLLSMVSISNKTSKPIDFWLENPYSTNDNSIDQSLYIKNSHIFRNTINNKILYCGGTGKVVYILSLKGNKVDSLIKIYDEVSPNKTAEGGLNFVLTEDVNWNIFAKVTDKFVYLRPFKYNEDYSDYKGYPFYFSEILEIYDWNGNHIIDMKFDTPFYDFIIDEDNHFVLILTMDSKTDDVIVKKYEINNISELKE